MIDEYRQLAQIAVQQVRDEKDKEIERLNNIIKEAKEYIENEWNCNFSEICKKQPQKLLEILDKVGSDKE